MSYFDLIWHHFDLTLQYYFTGYVGGNGFGVVAIDNVRVTQLEGKTYLFVNVMHVLFENLICFHGIIKKYTLKDQQSKLKLINYNLMVHVIAINTRLLRV